MVAPAPWTYVSAVPTSAAAIMRQLDLRGSANLCGDTAGSTCRGGAAKTGDKSGDGAIQAAALDADGLDNDALVGDEVVLTTVMDSRRMCVEVHASSSSIAPTTSPSTTPTTTPTTSANTTPTTTNNPSTIITPSTPTTISNPVTFDVREEVDHRRITTANTTTTICDNDDTTKTLSCAPTNSDHHHLRHAFHLSAHCTDQHHAPLASPDLSVISGSDSDIAGSSGTINAHTTNSINPTTTTTTTSTTADCNSCCNGTVDSSSPSTTSSCTSPSSSSCSASCSQHIQITRNNGSRPASLVLGPGSPMDLG